MIIRNIVVSLVVGSFGVLGFWLLAAGLEEAATAWESASWPSAPGTILAAVVDKSGGGRSGPSYKPRIAYRYTVYGETLAGSMIAPGRDWNYGSSVDAVGRFFAGSRPPVFYSPSRPQEAVLVPGLHASSFTGALYGIFFLQLSLFSFLCFLQKQQESSRTRKKRTALDRISLGLMMVGGAELLAMWVLRSQDL